MDDEPRRVVYFEFYDEKIAEEFGDAVMQWLSEMVEAPEHLATQAAQEFGVCRCPRHWLYEDATPSIGPYPLQG